MLRHWSQLVPDMSTDIRNTIYLPDVPKQRDLGSNPGVLALLSLQKLWSVDAVSVVTLHLTITE